MKMYQKGFTLLELVVALIAVSILGSVAVVSYSAYIEQAQLQEANNLSKSMTPIIFSNLKNDRCTSSTSSNTLIGKYGRSTISGSPLTTNDSLDICKSGCSVTYTFNDSLVSGRLKGKTIKMDLLNSGEFTLDKGLDATTLPTDLQKRLQTKDREYFECYENNPPENPNRTPTVQHTSTMFQLLTQFKNAQDYKRVVTPNISDLQKHFIPEANSTTAIYTFPVAVADSQLTDTGETGFDLSNITVNLSPSVLISSETPVTFDNLSLKVGYRNGAPYVESEVIVNPASLATTQKFSEIRVTIFNELEQLYTAVHPTNGGQPTYIGKYDYRYDPSIKMLVEFVGKN